MDRTARLSTLAGGISLGTMAGRATGTLTGVFKDLNDGRDVLVSNRHVLIGNVGDAVIQPGQADGGTGKDRVGAIKRYVGIRMLTWWQELVYSIYRLFGIRRNWGNHVDVACASIEAADRAISGGAYLDDGSIIHPRKTHPGDNIRGRSVWKSGRSTGVTYGVVIDDVATVKVYYDDDKAAIFEDVIVVQGRSAPGDSGSPVFLMASDKPSEDDEFCGILFAGSEGYYIACKYKWIQGLLNVSWQ